MASPAPLVGTTALVTGGAGGLGKAIARGFLDAGANVVVCDVNETRLAETRAEFESAGAADRFLAVTTDITDEAAVDALFAQAAARFGARLDVLVNNAGVVDAFDPVGDLSKASWDRLIGVNLTGSFLCMRGAVRAMQAANAQSPGTGGVLIQICSVASHLGSTAGAAYTASKHGAAALVRHTAGHYGEEGICAVGLMLGVMLDTNMTEGMAALGGLNQVGFARASASYAAIDPQRDSVRLADVADYCVVLARHRGIVTSLNGSCVPFNRNWPKA